MIILCLLFYAAGIIFDRFYASYSDVEGFYCTCHLHFDHTIIVEATAIPSDVGSQLALGEDVLDGSHLRAKASPSFRLDDAGWKVGVFPKMVRDMQRIPNGFQLK